MTRSSLALILPLLILVSCTKTKLQATEDESPGLDKAGAAAAQTCAVGADCNKAETKSKETDNEAETSKASPVKMATTGHEANVGKGSKASTKRK